MAKRAKLTGPLAQRLQSNRAAADQEQVAPAGEGDAKPEHDPTDTKTLLVRINRAGWQELRRLSIDLDRPVDSLMIEAGNSLLARHGKPAVIEKRLPAPKK